MYTYRLEGYDDKEIVVDAQRHFATYNNLPTAKVQEIEVKGATFVMGSTMVTKTPDDIEKIVLKNYPNAYEIVITQGQDGNNIYYIADFLTDKFDGELKLDPVTGAICERELEYF